jgi:RimJ/RimL family protein N-acetyltransferase
MNRQTSFNLQPLLENDLLILRPLLEDDFDDLYRIASDPLIWEQHPSKDRYQQGVFSIFFKDAMLSGGAFVVINKETRQIIGSTRFHLIKEAPNAVEIGWTFLARQFWGGRWNRSMKSLLIHYAFDFVDNVLFYIGKDNFRSQRAVEKIGGEQITSIEGQMLEVRQDASVMYNISKKKWEPLGK